MNLARTHIQALRGYRPPLAGRTEYDGLLLDFNERSQAPSDAVLTAISSVSINRYPEYERLIGELARYADVSDDQILLTNGSDHGIDVVFRTFVDPGDKLVLPMPGFGMTTQAAELADGCLITPSYIVPDLSYPVDEVIASIDPTVKLIVVCNPNSPTGTLTPVEVIERIAAAAPRTVVMVDEAYFEFCGLTAAPLVNTYPNIAVTRTFSKAFGLAGLRIGYVIAAAAHVTEMRKVCGPYSVGATAQAGALASLLNLDQMTAYVDEVMTQAKPRLEDYFRQNGIWYHPSSANFILFRPTEQESTLTALTKEGILVRPQHHAAIPGTLRVTIGSVDEMKRFISVYERLPETR